MVNKDVYILELSILIMLASHCRFQQREIAY